MNAKTFGHKLSAVGSLLAGGSTATAILTAPGAESVPSAWVPTLHAIAIGTIIAGVVISAMGKLIATWTDDEGSATLQESDGKFPLPFVVIGTCALLALCGCETATPNRKRAEVSQMAAYEQAHKNDVASYEKMRAANLVNYQRKKDLELKADLQSLDVQSKLDATRWTASAVAAETARLHAEHDSAIAAYKERVAAADALRAENEQVNIGTARQIGAALNPQKPPALVDQSAAIDAGAGTVPVPPPLIEK